VVCPSCNEPTRIGHATLPNGDHVRVCKKCNETIDQGRR
jgi:large subunit ribosomal protein L24